VRCNLFACFSIAHRRAEAARLDNDGRIARVPVADAEDVQPASIDIDVLSWRRVAARFAADAEPLVQRACAKEGEDDDADDKQEAAKSAHAARPPLEYAEGEPTPRAGPRAGAREGTREAPVRRR
jgi:hypothetical protein